jgi:hypothetical protein
MVRLRVLAVRDGDVLAALDALHFDVASANVSDACAIMALGGRAHVVDHLTVVIDPP